MSARKRTIGIIAAIAIAVGIVTAFALSGNGFRDTDSRGTGGAGSSESNDDWSGPDPVASAMSPAHAVVDHASAQFAALGVSQAVFESAHVVILTADDSWEAASYGALLGVPVLVADDATESTSDGGDETPVPPTLSQELLDELDRLETNIVLLNGIPADAIDGFETYTLDETGASLAKDLGLDLVYAAQPADLQSGIDGLGTTVFATEPTSTADFDGEFAAAERLDDAVALTDGAYLAALGTAAAAGAGVQISDLDPRATSDTVAALDGQQNVVAIFSEENPDLGWQLATAATGTQLPGGGQLVFEGKRYVALYGSPHSAALGVLGEQGTEGTIVRADAHAELYRDLTDDQVVPALEIIVTVASGAPGDDGNYSNEWAIEGFLPLVEAAEEAGQYVVLDFQPGRSDFLTQVRMYEPLLEYPHVGIALDPEWRLGPTEVPLTRIGHVEIAEVNEVVTYLADFTRERDLPQKMLILHQFQVQMLRDIDQLDQSRSELAILVHADGQGSQGAKQATWATLLNNAPHIEYWGWKNFYDEDIPMLDPVGTIEVEPQPHFVSYQ